MLRTYQSLIRICREEFSDVVEETQIMRAGSLGSAKLRILLKAQSPNLKPRTLNPELQMPDYTARNLLEAVWQIVDNKV